MITLFLSHASEDLEYFVRPLAEALKSDFKVWYSEYELTLVRGKGSGLEY
jgi:hypothetical protein